MRTQRLKCFDCGQVSQVMITCDSPKCPSCGSLDVRQPNPFLTDKQELRLFHVNIGMGGVGTRLEKVHTTSISVSEVHYKKVTADNREYRSWLSAFREQHEFWYSTASDAWMHYANLLNQQIQKEQREIISLTERANQAVEASRLCKEKEEFEARPSHKLRVSLKGPIVSIETVLSVPKDADHKEIHDLVNAVHPSNWVITGPGVGFPNLNGVSLRWDPFEEEPAAK